MRLRVLLVLLLAGLSFVSLEPFHLGIRVMAQPFRPTVPIVIVGDAGFTPNNGVSSGVGTSSDPYVLRDWNTSSVTVQNTRAYFIVRHVVAYAITFQNVSNGRLDNVIAPYFTINISNSKGIVISNTTVLTSAPAQNSLMLLHSTNVTVSADSILNHGTGYGLYVTFSTNITIASSIFTGNQRGIQVENSTNINISKNQLSNSDTDIFLTSSQVLISGNNLTRGLSISESTPAGYRSYAVSRDNLVNGKPLYFLKDTDNMMIVSKPVGQVIASNCRNLLLSGVNIDNVNTAISLTSLKGAALKNSTFSNDAVAVAALNSTELMITGNNIRNSSVGIVIGGTKNTVENNTISNAMTGVDVGGSYNVLDDNTIFTSYEGIAVSASNHPFGPVIIEGPLLLSSNRIIGSTTFGIEVRGYGPDNGNITVVNNIIAWSGDRGIHFDYVTLGWINVANNSLTNNSVGIHIQGVITRHTLVYHNNFLFNSFPAITEHMSLNATYPVGGNYWSGFTGSDNCNGPTQRICDSPDGIIDTPFNVQNNFNPTDNYPLASPYIPPNVKPPQWLPATSLGYSNLSNSSVTINWATYTPYGFLGVASLRLYKDDSLIASFGQGGPENSCYLCTQTSSYIVNGLMQNTTYRFRLEATDLLGHESTAGPAMSVTTLSLTGHSNSTSNSNSGSILTKYWYVIAPLAVLIVLLPISLVFWKRKRLLSATAYVRGATGISSPRISFAASLMDSMLV